MFPRFRRILEVLPSQGLATAANIFYGFLCVRILPISEYAKYTVVFSVLGSLTILSDISLSGSIIPLIGDRINDSQLIADYVASLRQLAHRVYFILAPVALCVFPWMVRRQPWDWKIVSGMLAILLAAAWFARLSGSYGSVLIVRRERQRWYLAQKISSVGTLALLLIFWMMHWINAFAAILINLGGILFVGTFYYIRARKLLKVRGHASKEKRRAIIHLAIPSIPGSIFYALQGQISIFLITIFGQSKSVANIGALGRLLQIYVIFAQLNPILVEPYFAKIAKAQLKSSYFAAAAGAGALCLAIIGMAASFPQAFLWVLGPKYAGLNVELLLLIASASISYFSGVLYVVHCARRFVYWWSALLTILLTVLLQGIYIWKVDLSTMTSVLILGLLTNATSLLVVILTGVYGFLFGPREIREHKSDGAPV